jgi:hypothetical protein
VEELGLTPTMVLLRNAEHLALVETVVPPECRILVGDTTDTSVLAIPTMAKIGLVDSTLTSALSGVFEGLGITSVYYT